MVPPGFSGGVVFECQSEVGSRFALKGWATGTDLERVKEVHTVATFARQSGCVLVPAIHGVASAEGRQWELASWMPGEPALADASLDQIHSGAIALRQFHKAVAPCKQVQQPAPAVSARLRRIEQLRPLVTQMLQSRESPCAITTRPTPLSNAVGRASEILRRHWLPTADRITSELMDLQDCYVVTQYVLRDCHRDHVLFSDGRPSGLIDFDALRIDTPSADLARWVGGFLIRRDASVQNGKREDAVWQAAMAGFGLENVLEAQTIHAATVWSSLANWLVWIVLEQRSFPAGPDAVARRIDEITELAAQYQSRNTGKRRKLHKP
ncbi:Phosphotransferase enzyme family protein [Rubripirellula reticaptiva]|uniref:Phosphotransferase enzyme family protein n=2 Tax=Rubripirellula reticaptiva TaxID=2528013 RepID=A0A5C6EZN9_9BACT|nr:Phosphotransferase enzyme family protein [Rubripirellula reticaptiva]